MRTVSLSIAKLNLNIGDVINIKLTNSVGADAITDAGYSFNQDITIDADTISVELLENSLTDVITKYKLTLPSGIEFSFTVPASNDTTPHDLFFLVKAGCFYGIFYEIDEVSKIDSYFLNKLDNFFQGQDIFFTEAEQELIDFYIYYADEIKDKGSTVDVERMFDEYLAGLGV